MIRSIAAAITALMITACSTLPETTAPALTATDLNGTWDVELYYSPTEPPSTTVMVLKAREGDVLMGSFYESPFADAETSLRGDVLAFGAVTSDGKADYNHSGRLRADGKIDGQTHALGRDFLMIWTATKRPPA